MTASAPTEPSLDDVLQQAITAHQAGHYEQAEDLYLAILQAQPYHAVANHNMGLLAGQVGQFAAGLPYLHKALSVNPDEGQFWLSYADGLLKAGEQTEALDIIETAISRGLDNDAAQQLLARITAAIATTPTLGERQSIIDFYQTGQYAALEQASRELTAKYPQSDFAWSALGTALQVQDKDALEVLQKTVELAPHDAEAHGNLGIAWHARCQYSQAVVSYLHALQLNPGFVEAHANLGASRQAQGDLAGAEHAFRQALALRPDYAKAHFNLGNTLAALQRHEEAVSSYESALVLLPHDAEVMCNLGNALQALARYESAVDTYRRALAINPGLNIAHSNLGAALLQLEQYALAEASYRTALAAAPLDAALWNGLANCLEGQEKLDTAAEAYRQGIAVRPAYATLQSNLGRLLAKQNDYPSATRYFRTALDLQPALADTHSQLALTMQAQNQFDEALQLHQRAVELEPDHYFAWSNLGHCLRQMRRFEEATIAYERAISLKPLEARFHNDLALVLQDAGMYEKALDAYRRAVELEPYNALIYTNFGVALEELGRPAEALVQLELALVHAPESSRAHFNKGNCLRSMRRFVEALASYERAQALQPDFAGVYMNIGSVLSEIGRLQEAIATFRKGMEHAPESSALYSNLLFCLSHVQIDNADSLIAEHTGFAERFEVPLRQHWQPHGNDPDPDRPLKVGLVSGDFCNHAVAHFIIPLIEHLAAMPQFELYAYYNNRRIDSITARIADLIPNWLPITHMAPEELAQRVRSDRIDILIDLSGHTANNCLPAFAHKPAPLQVSWIGYPMTTGLQAMDYYFGDRFMTPPDEFAHQFTEKLVLLPTIAPFLPSHFAPNIAAAPALTNGFLTFGSFNRINKLNRETIARWGRVLRAVPEARMLVAAMPEAGPQPKLTAWFAEEGIAAERLEYVARAGMADFLTLHHRVDICLDTVPYGGGTTTFHGLWMGVPILTAAGNTPPSRAGTAILRHLDLEEFIASNDDELIAKAQAMARNPMLLGALRYSTRHRLEHSAFGRPDLIAEGVANGLRMAWHRWCAGLPAENFEAPTGVVHMGNIR